MNSTLENYFINTYRELFPPSDIMKDMTKSCLYWGMDCEDGWAPILETTFKKLVLLKHKPILAQVKEKFGTLHIYLDNATDEASKIVEDAERASEYTCEICGEPGDLRKNNGWYMVRCEKHHREFLENMKKGVLRYGH
jgi:hypothetical protein